MKVLVCIDNNLKFDSRLKRHVTALSKISETVYVLTNSSPDEGFGLNINNVKQVCYEKNKYQYGSSVTPQILCDELRQLGIYEEIKESCPFVDESEYYFEEVMQEYFKYLDESLKGERWRDITNRIPEEMIHQHAMSYIVGFLITSVYMAKAAMEIEADVVLCNDIDTLLCGVLHKKKWGSKIVFDIQDIMCDISRGVFPLAYSEMLFKYENTFIGYADRVIGVGDYILKWSQLHHGIKVPCIPIYSCNKKESMSGVLPKKYDDKQVIRIYFHGFAHEARKLDVVIKGAMNVEGIKIVLRCEENEYMSKIRNLVKELGMEEKVEFLQMVPTEEVIRSANRDGDIGIYASVPDGCVNWSASFTNKFMEYLGAGLPIITTMAEDQMRVVCENQCGFVLENDSVECVESMYRHVLENRDKLSVMSENSWRVAREVFDWDQFEKRFLDVIKGDDIDNYAISPLTQEQLELVNKWDAEDKINRYEYVIPEINPIGKSNVRFLAKWYAERVSLKIKFRNLIFILMGILLSDLFRPLIASGTIAVFNSSVLAWTCFYLINVALLVLLLEVGAAIFLRCAWEAYRILRRIKK